MLNKYIKKNSQQTNIHAPGGIRTHDFSRRVAADLRLRPRGHCDRHSNGAKKSAAAAAAAAAAGGRGRTTFVTAVLPVTHLIPHKRSAE